MEIANLNKDLLQEVADDSVNYCSNTLKKLADIIQSTN